MKYIARVIESQIRQAAKQFPVIALTGPRQTGKLTLLQKLFSSYSYVSLDDPSLRLAAATDPGLFIENLKLPVIIDEIQYSPQVLPFIKMAVDRDRAKNGLFILTGSQMFPLMSGISESLAGRIALFELLGFSWEELSPLPKTSLACYKQMLKGFYPVPASQKMMFRDTMPAIFRHILKEIAVKFRMFRTYRYFSCSFSLWRPEPASF